MFKVTVKDQVILFSTHAEASRFVRGLRAKRIVARLETIEPRNDRGMLGGYGGMNALRPVHCLGR
jgi:hypothetical protein